jgi:hypothetical protein
MSLIGSSLSLTLRIYAGLGGVNTTALTVVDEAAVLATDAGAVPGIFLANTVLCSLLVAVIQQAALNPASENFCSALESAASSYESATSSSITSLTLTSITASKSTSTTAPEATSAASGLLPAGFNSNNASSAFSTPTSTPCTPSPPKPATTPPSHLPAHLTYPASSATPKSPLSSQYSNRYALPRARHSTSRLLSMIWEAIILRIWLKLWIS